MLRLANPTSPQSPIDALLPEISAREWRGRIDARPEANDGWRAAVAREYLEVVCAIGAVTLAGWFVPLTYHTYGLIYLLAVIVLSLRVGRWPVLVAALLSAATWIFVFIPPRLSFAVLESDDGLLLGTYLIVALVAGQLTSRLRAKEQQERARERRATALFHLTRAIAEAPAFDDAVEAVLRQADNLFAAETALLVPGPHGGLRPHPAASFAPDERERAAAECAAERRCETGRSTEILPGVAGWHVPLVRGERALGVFSVRWPDDAAGRPPAQRDLLGAFAAQLALLVEREHLRAAGEREQLLAASERLHRTLLDSVSHELKTPLAVLRAAGEKLATDDASKRASLAAEINTATRRLDRLVTDLLGQTRLESGVLAPQLDWCDARDVVHAARRAVGDALAGRTLKVEIPAEMPLFLADAPLMEHVVANLLWNACRHTPAGTAVKVTAGVAPRDGREMVFLSVADRGPGVAAELRETLFQKFQRGPNARPGGLGLGLSIVRGFMLAQGGGVAAGDHPGGGACFTVFLPHTAHGGVPNDER